MTTFVKALTTFVKALTVFVKALTVWDWLAILAVGIFIGCGITAAVTGNDYWLIPAGIAGLLFLS